MNSEKLYQSQLGQKIFSLPYEGKSYIAAYFYKQCFPYPLPSSQMVAIKSFFDNLRIALLLSVPKNKQGPEYDNFIEKTANVVQPLMDVVVDGERPLLKFLNDALASYLQLDLFDEKSIPPLEPNVPYIIRSKGVQYEKNNCSP